MLLPILKQRYDSTARCASCEVGSKAGILIAMNYSSASEVNRQLGKAADGGIKLFFKWMGIGIKGLAQFIVEAFHSIIGK